MNKIIFTLLLFILSNHCFSQINTDSLRTIAYQAMINGDIDKSVTNYNKILEITPDDYDAILALARLYFGKEDYEKSIAYYNKIYISDTSDAEALKGLGNNYLYLDKLNSAIIFFKKAVLLYPTVTDNYFLLAKAYSWQGKLNDAIKTYQQILNIDSTYSEIYQGIGKMYYWKSQPYKALKYYEKALLLDSLEENIKNEYRQIKDETLNFIFIKSKFANEVEENYKINAFIQQTGIRKRISDRFFASADLLIDHSERNSNSAELNDTLRWYNALTVNLRAYLNNHSVDLFTGYSHSDNKFSLIGCSWKWNFPINPFNITNKITGKYDYFYYWNKVGQNVVTDNISIEYKKLKFGFEYGLGIVDKAFILDVSNDRYEEDKNPFSSHTVSLTYRIFSKPKISVAANYSFLNYKFKSNQYYSPLGKKVFGPSFVMYYPIGNFYFYSDAMYNFGEEYYYEKNNSELTKQYLNAKYWNANIEIGYEKKSFSASINASRFNNNYYKNFFLTLNIGYRF